MSKKHGKENQSIGGFDISNIKTASAAEVENAGADNLPPAVNKAQKASAPINNRRLAKFKK